MAAPNLDVERAAKALVDSVFMTDREAAERHDIARRTLSRYRRRIDREDERYTPELAQLVTLKLAEARNADDWADELTDTIRTAMSFIRTACDDLDTTNPEHVGRVSDALSILMEANLAKQVIDAKLAEQGGSHGAEDQQKSSSFGSVQAQA